MEAKAELLPCPFCGRNAHLDTVGFGGSRHYAVFCDDVTCNGVSHGAGANVALQKQHAIERWNRRAAPPAYAEGGEKSSTLKAAIAHLWSMQTQMMTENLDGLTPYELWDRSPQHIKAMRIDAMREAIAVNASASPVVGDYAALKDVARAAYIAGATAVHEHCGENPGEAPNGDPEFGEAADDYAASIDVAALPQGDSGAGELVSLLGDSRLCATPEWSVVPDAGKPILRHAKGGNVARGYLGTWREFDLIAALLNRLFSSDIASPTASTEAGEGIELILAEQIVATVQEEIPALDGYDEDELASLEAQIATLIRAALSAPAPSTEALAKAAADIKARLAEPRRGRTHGTWDRGYDAGLKAALGIINAATPTNGGDDGRD